MLTKFFPYGNGEAFIENEMKVLSEYYDQIVIFACEVPKNEIIKRDIPDNVEAYRISSISKKIDIINGLFHSKNFDKNYRMEKKYCNTFLKKCILDYFEEKSHRIYNEILKSRILDKFTSEPFLIYSYWFFMTARVGVLISENYKPAIMFSRAHGYDLYEERNKVKYLPYRRLFLEKYDYVFPCSEHGTNHLKKLYPELSNNVKTSLLGTLDHGIGKASSDGKIRIVSCSRVEPVKRVEKIVDSLAELDTNNINIEWTHIGDGSGFDKLKMYAAEKLKFIPVNFKGNMNNKEVMKYYSTNPVDLFLNVSSSEGLPVSIMEAMSYGIPCIATDVGGSSEIVINNLTGRLIPGDFEKKELASIITDFINNNNKRNEFRINCRNYWCQKFQAISNYHKLHSEINDYCKKNYK